VFPARRFLAIPAGETRFPLDEHASINIITGMLSTFFGFF
jgi:hypothetical protein